MKNFLLPRALILGLLTIQLGIAMLAQEAANDSTIIIISEDQKKPFEKFIKENSPTETGINYSEISVNNQKKWVPILFDAKKKTAYTFPLWNRQKNKFLYVDPNQFYPVPTIPTTGGGNPVPIVNPFGMEFIMVDKAKNQFIPGANATGAETIKIPLSELKDIKELSNGK